jgi:phosphate transport system substrate-binding protein
MTLSQLTKMAGTAVIASLILVGCGPTTEAPAGETKTTGSEPTSATAKADYGDQTLDIDGSNTVFPVASAFVELFSMDKGEAKITVSKAGTGAGMEKFAKGEVGIANASRPIKEDEIAEITKAGIEFIEAPIALDGLCIVVSNENTWLKSITIEQLNKIWNKDSKVKMWNEVDPSWPKEEIKLYGATDAHGTYEYFNEVINGKKDNVRADYSAQAEYDPLVQGVANEKNSLGYVGFAYYIESKDKIRAVPVDAGKGAIEPTEATIIDGTYAPLSRPLFVYINKAKLTESTLLKDFVAYMFGDKNADGVTGGDYIPLPAETLGLVKARVEAQKTGSIFSKPEAGKSMFELLTAAQ